MAQNNNTGVTALKKTISYKSAHLCVPDGSLGVIVLPVSLVGGVSPVKLVVHAASLAACGTVSQASLLLATPMLDCGRLLSEGKQLTKPQLPTCAPQDELVNLCIS